MFSFLPTLFINMASRPDRHQQVLEQLRSVGILEPERLEAIVPEDRNGKIGCTMSHIKCLEIAKKNRWDFVFICEDDILFTDVPTFQKNLMKLWKNGYWLKPDVIVVGGNVFPPFNYLSDQGGLRIFNCQTTTGYIVFRHYYTKLLQNFREGLDLLTRNPENTGPFCIDQHWKRLQQIDKWFIVFPLTVVQQAGESDIEGHFVDYQGLMLDHKKEKTAIRKTMQFV